MFSTDNLSKPSNRKWKSIADFFLFTLPLYLGAMMTIPIDEELKLWISFGLTMVVITLKGLSKLTAEETI